MVDVVVIGGGVSGLATAVDLMRRGHDVQLLERQVRTGGNATSIQFDGFLMERGPTTINASFPEANQWVSDLALASDAVDLGKGVRNRYLQDQRGLHGIAPTLRGFFLSGYLSPKAKLAMATEVFRRRKQGPSEETVHGFVARRFGQEFADKVIDPLVAGIFMGDSKNLSIGGAFPKLAEMEQRCGSITKGVLAAKSGSEPGRRLFSWPEGIGVLPQTMTNLLADRVKTGIAVQKIRRLSDGFEIATAGHGTIVSKAVVLAVQPHVATELLEPIDSDASSVIREITAPSVGVVFLGYKSSQVDHALDGLGFLCTKSAGKLVSGVQFNSTMFPNRAPAGHVSISAYVGGARISELAKLPDSELIDAVSTEIAQSLGISGMPVVARTHRWLRGLPQYSMGHADRRAKIAALSERSPGIYVTGNYLDGVSIAACLKSAGETALHVSGYLGKCKPNRDRGRAMHRSLHQQTKSSVPGG